MTDVSRIQLWVERQALDPAAWTATHALQLLLGFDAPARVGRADLWELEVESPAADEILEGAGEGGAGGGPAALFEPWMRASNLFLNPSRDRGLLLDGAPPDQAPGTAHVVTVERG